MTRSLEPDDSPQPTVAASWPGTVELIDPPGQALMFRIILAIVALEPLFVLVVLLIAGVPWWIVLLIIALMVVGVPLLVAVIMTLLWRRFARRYPPRPIDRSAVGKSFQSFGFGALAPLNNCIHIAADEHHLHLVPMKPLRFCGASPASLPWSRIRDPKPSLLPQLMRAQIDGQSIIGPAWCLKLADERGIEENSSKA